MSDPPEPPHPDEELRKASDSVVLYEFEMLSSLAHDICERQEREWFLDNARLESFGLHARQQARFYFESAPPRARNPKADDDLYATDYFGDPVKWKRLRGRRPDELSHENLGRRFAHEMAHATFKRRNFKEDRPSWFVYRIFSALVPTVENFAEAVDDARLVADFLERVRKAQPLKQPPPPEPHRPGGYGVAATMEEAVAAATRGLSPHDQR